MFSLSKEGYVTTYLTAGPALSDFVAPYQLKDQLRFEKEMRDLYYEAPVGCPSAAVLGEKSPIGEEWKFYSDNKNHYIDFSKFYFTLQRVTFLAKTILVSDKAKKVRARVWSYAAFDMWVNGGHVVTEKVPVYQPIRHTDITIDLSEGENEVFFHIQNFGVRDTRNMLAFQLYDTDGISVTLPVDADVLEKLHLADEWFAGLRISEDKLVAPASPISDVKITLDGKSVKPYCECGTVVGDAFTVLVEGECAGQTFKRRFERYEKKRIPKREWGEADVILDNARVFLEANGYYTRTRDDYYNTIGINVVAHSVLCHALLNGKKLDEADFLDLEHSCEMVTIRKDCSDFELSCLLRILKQLDPPAEVREKIKKTVLAFRYWMDEEGADAMCFWSENHALFFHGCQMIAGEIFPDEQFLRSKRDGRGQYAEGYRRVTEWFDVVENEGFEEFLAGGYLGVTIAALLMIYDFGDEILRERAGRTIDRIVREAALQCYQGIHIAPMGRIYRTALIPYCSTLQALLHIIDDKNADGVSCWFAPLGYSDYKLPGDVSELIHGEIDTVFNTGRAEVHTRKMHGTMLTSVASPRKTPLPEEKFRDTEYYATKVMNESFHGTSLFTPGGDGYQQHLWYAAISDSFYTFVNLPGSERDFCSMRPGYWYGNLVFPAILQEGRELYCHYSIPDRVPTKFTHAYFPSYAADEIVVKDGFRFARCADSYLALWCSEPLVLWNADAVVDADYRAYGEDTSWYVKVGSKSEDGSFEEFVGSVMASDITKSAIKKKLGL